MCTIKGILIHARKDEVRQKNIFTKTVQSYSDPKTSTILYYINIAGAIGIIPQGKVESKVQCICNIQYLAQPTLTILRGRRGEKLRVSKVHGRRSGDEV